MNIDHQVNKIIMDIVYARLGERVKDYHFPPPVFRLMKGEFVELDLKTNKLRTRFPVLEDFLNPYGSMQGGMIAAAIDNTLGPLSVVVAPVNVTRTLEIKYSQAVRPEMGSITCEARFLKRDGQWLYLEAEVCSPEGQRLAKAKAVHWIIA